MRHFILILLFNILGIRSYKYKIYNTDFRKVTDALHLKVKFPWTNQTGIVTSFNSVFFHAETLLKGKWLNK